MLTPPGLARPALPVTWRQPGTPVNVVGSEGDMAQVALLDVHWQWAPPRQCAAVRNGPVWIEKSAIGAEYPADGLQRQ